MKVNKPHMKYKFVKLSNVNIDISNLDIFIFHFLRVFNSSLLVTTYMKYGRDNSDIFFSFYLTCHVACPTKFLSSS